MHREENDEKRKKHIFMQKKIKQYFIIRNSFRNTNKIFRSCMNNIKKLKNKYTNIKNLSGNLVAV